jgi:hypothetical protein
MVEPCVVRDGPRAARVAKDTSMRGFSLVFGVDFRIGTSNP